MSYKEGIIKSIEELKDRNGSSMISIKKHMQANLPKDKKWINGFFLMAIRSSVIAGDFVKVKNSFKLSLEFKKKRSDLLKPKKKAVAVKKSVSKKKSVPKKKVSTKKTTGKKKTVAKKATKKTVKKATKKTVKNTVKKTSAKKTVKKTSAKKQ